MPKNKGQFAVADHKVMVEGFFPFPYQLLYAERLAPFDSTDADILEEAFPPNNPKKRLKVTLCRFAGPDWTPDEKLWANYGWEVIDHEVDADIDEEDLR